MAENHKNKEFGIFDQDDIKQQTRLICWQKVNEFDFTRRKAKNAEQALENWLNRVVSNRLKNLYRDNVKGYNKQFKSDCGEIDKKKRESLLNPASLSDIIEDGFYDIDNLENKEVVDMIINNLTAENIDILDAMFSGENIGSYYKKKLFENIRVILDDQ